MVHVHVSGQVKISIYLKISDLFDRFDLFDGFDLFDRLDFFVKNWQICQNFAWEAFQGNFILESLFNKSTPFDL